MERCGWVGDDPLYQAYHDTEWGVPETDGRALWEQLMLEGFQAGLSWITILRKRETFRAAFAGFDPEVVARWGEAEVERLLGDPGIVRHRGKIEGTIEGARAFLALEEAGPGFSRFVWDHVDGVPIRNAWTDLGHVPAETPLSRQVSKALKARGFKFCGPTITYAFLQAAGLVNDHVTRCARHGPVTRMTGPGET
ncbi:DNA-3-methyladenine glycosylase I [Jannaschia marina]|uniref:DNA-3-methyladenine glycosylase I n=1 Tax=Jannaschia marina TaxID=2741674 RepID=UPI0015CA4F64|nr:DNA-3-methyladenine glycosylase I [Jannaschia marina]